MKSDTTKQKQMSAARLAKMIQLPVKDSFTNEHTRYETAKFKNLTSAMSRHMAQEDRVMALVTLTFGTCYRIDFKHMCDTKIKSIAQAQYNSLKSFIYKMRKSKKFNHDIRYFAVFELQSEGSLHMHIYISVVQGELFSLIEFIYDFKRRHNKPYIYNGKQAFPIGRSHIGISSIHQKKFERKYTLKDTPDKKDPDRTYYLMKELESRNFRKGDWTALEFYSKSMMEKRYDEKILKYLEKTIDGNFCLDNKDIKEGVTKCQLGHDTKSIFDDNHLTQLQVAFIRQVCGDLYTRSRLPFPHNLYQSYRNDLIAFNGDYKVYYRCIEDLVNGMLTIQDDNISTVDGYLITNNKYKTG